MELRGSSSGATAVVSAKRLISDLGANLIGSFYIPNPNVVIIQNLKQELKHLLLLITH